MTTVIGTYVATFAEATHALPDGMHMSADYPFMLPKIQTKDAVSITIVGRAGETATLAIKRGKRGDFCELAQTSSFERLFRRKPTTFRMMPFKEGAR